MELLCCISLSSKNALKKFFFDCSMVSDNLQSCPDPGHLQARQVLEESQSTEWKIEQLHN